MNNDAGNIDQKMEHVTFEVIRDWIAKLWKCENTKTQSFCYAISSFLILKIFILPALK